MKNIFAQGKKKALFKSLISVLGCSCLLFTLSACGNDNQATVATTDTTSATFTNSANKVVIKVGYEYAKNGSFDLGMRRWQEELRNISNGSMDLELFPDDSLGDKQDLLQRIKSGENIVSPALAADFYALGSYDLGIFSGPYLFKNWDEAYHLSKSKWFEKENQELHSKHGIHIISTLWNNSIRYLLSSRPITQFKELDSLRIRVPNNDIQNYTWKVFGATPVAIPNSQLKRAFANKEIDAADLTTARIYTMGLYNDAKYLLLTSHVYSINNMVIGAKYWDSLTSAQQQMLTDSCNRAAKFYNVVQEANEYTILKEMKAAGLTITRPSPEMLAKLNQRANTFYTLPVFKKWSPGLYYKVLGAKAIPWAYYTNGGKMPEGKK